MANSSSRPAVAPGEKELSPAGVLSIHIKKCKNLRLTDALKDFSKQSAVNIYFKLHVGDATKITTVNNCKYGNKTGMMLDDMKHFLLEVNSLLDDSSNKIRIIMVGFQGQGRHRKIGEKDIHLFNIIKNQYLIETVEFTQNGRGIGDVEMELAFSYGCFGYGYSAQLQNHQRTCSEQVQHSLFYRVLVPPERDMEGRHVLASAATAHPPFIDWSVKVDLGTDGHATSTVSCKTAADYPFLIQKMQRRLYDLHSQYSRLSKRTERVQFMQSLGFSKPVLQENESQSRDLLAFSTKGSKAEKSNMEPAFDRESLDSLEADATDEADGAAPHLLLPWQSEETSTARGIRQRRPQLHNWNEVLNEEGLEAEEHGLEQTHQGAETGWALAGAGQLGKWTNIMRLSKKFFGIDDKQSIPRMGSYASKLWPGSRDSLRIIRDTSQLKMEGMPPTSHGGSPRSSFNTAMSAGGREGVADPQNASKILAAASRNHGGKNLFTRLMATIGLAGNTHEKPVLATLKDLPKITLTPAPPLHASCEDLLSHSRETITQDKDDRA